MRPDGSVVEVLADGRERPIPDTPMRPMTPQEVEEAAHADPDARPMTSEEMARARRVPRIKTLRRALGLTQEEFATRYRIPLGTLRDWEQGRSEPDQPARAYLTVIAHDPDGVQRALEDRSRAVQRYVSSELSHFVGKDKPEQEQYQLLLHILKTGWMLHKPFDPTQPRTASLDLSRPISTDRIIDYEVVCFCDIPSSDLATHIHKYSKFGLAFKKDLLIEKGACPVFYVPNDSPVPIAPDQLFAPGDFVDRIGKARTKGLVDRGLYFDTSVRAILDLLMALDTFCYGEDNRYFKGIDASEFRGRFAHLLGLSSAQVALVESGLKGKHEASQTVRRCTDFLLNWVFTFMKCFDAKRSFEDEDNYYMEREWRVGDNVRFSLDDVSRVFFPASYAQRFRTDLPSYVGQITFID